MMSSGLDDVFNKDLIFSITLASQILVASEDVWIVVRDDFSLLDYKVLDLLGIIYLELVTV